MKALERTTAGSRVEFSRRQLRQPIEVVISKEALHANTAAPSASSRPESHSPMNARLSLDVPGSCSPLCRLAVGQSKLKLGDRFPSAFKIALGVLIDRDPDCVATLVGSHLLGRHSLYVRDWPGSDAAPESSPTRVRSSRASFECSIAENCHAPKTCRVRTETPMHQDLHLQRCRARQHRRQDLEARRCCTRPKRGRHHSVTRHPGSCKYMNTTQPCPNRRKDRASDLLLRYLAKPSRRLLWFPNHLRLHRSRDGCHRPARTPSPCWSPCPPSP